MACASADECDIQTSLPSSRMVLTILTTADIARRSMAREGYPCSKSLGTSSSPRHLVMPEKMAETTCLTSFIYSTNGRRESTVFPPHSLLVSTPAEFIS